MRTLIFAAIALAAMSTSAFAFTPADASNLPDDIKPKWEALKSKKGSAEYVKFISTRNYVEACLRDVENPPEAWNLKKFSTTYVSQSESQLLSDAIVNWWVLHPTSALA